jgi:undecaprenyl diphosphate synthase
MRRGPSTPGPEPAATVSTAHRGAGAPRADVPRHIAIIMDGNGRWAQRRGLPRVEGHRAAIGSVREVVRTCGELGVEVLTLYAFSTENWKRPLREVQALMRLFVEIAATEVDDLIKNGVQVHVIGDRAGLPAAVRAAAAHLEGRTAGGRGLRLLLALNYGGRQEIVAAARSLVADARAGRLDPAQVDEAAVASRLTTAGLPDPDLVIRPSGEARLSNFMLWQAAYSEFWSTPVCWPDFGRRELMEAVEAYRRRRRRFGGLEQED